MCSDLDERNRVLCTRFALRHTHGFFDELVIVRDVFSIDGLLERPGHLMCLERERDRTSLWCKRFVSLPKVVRWDSIHPFVVRRWSVDWEILVSSWSSISDTHRLRTCLLLPVWDSRKHRATNQHIHHNRCRTWKERQSSVPITSLSIDLYFASSYGVWQRQTRRSLDHCVSCLHGSQMNSVILSARRGVRSTHLPCNHREQSSHWMKNFSGRSFCWQTQSMSERSISVWPFLFAEFLIVMIFFFGVGLVGFILGLIGVDLRCWTRFSSLSDGGTWDRRAFFVAGRTVLVGSGRWRVRFVTILFGVAFDVRAFLVSVSLVLLFLVFFVDGDGVWLFAVLLELDSSSCCSSFTGVACCCCLRTSCCCFSRCVCTCSLNRAVFRCKRCPMNSCRRASTRSVKQRVTRPVRWVEFCFSRRAFIVALLCSRSIFAVRLRRIASQIRNRIPSCGLNFGCNVARLAEALALFVSSFENFFADAMVCVSHRWSRRAAWLSAHSSFLDRGQSEEIPPRGLTVGVPISTVSDTTCCWSKSCCCCWTRRLFISSVDDGSVAIRDGVIVRKRRSCSLIDDKDGGGGGGDFALTIFEGTLSFAFEDWTVVGTRIICPSASFTTEKDFVACGGNGRLFDDEESPFPLTITTLPVSVFLKVTSAVNEEYGQWMVSLFVD